MENGNIADSKITTSSILDDKSLASQARLNYKADGGFGGGWSSLENDANQWLEVDLGTYTRVTRLATQGRNGHDQWVTYSSKLKNQYIEHLNLNKCFNKASVNDLNKYFDSIYSLSETLFKSVIKLNKKNPNISSKAFSRLKTLSTLRFNYYPKQTKPVEISKQDGVALGCETHVDSGVFTVLYQDRKGGLQVQNRKTKKWYDVPFNKKALVVNTGRALEFLSKGKYKATNHRVLWNKSKRLSVPFFFEPSYDFKMNKSFLNSTKYSNSGQIYEKFLNQSLKKFVEYQR